MAGNGLNSETPDCPLCLEPLGWDDINFYPCACRYQICRFCWHRIRTDENGLCPHCREPYPENPAEYTPPSQEQLAKVKSEKRQKTVERKQKLVDSRKNLAAVRVVQKNLVFVIGLSPRLADPEVLKKNEYFGKYGRIYKVVINNHTVYNGAQGPSVSAYVTYYRSEDASKAIQAVNNAYIDGRYLKVSFGTTKYCTYFLRGTQCTKPDCMYLHALGDEEASFTKEDMQMGKHQVFESAALAATNPPVKEQATSKKQQQPLRNTGPSPTTTLDAPESILPATASWASSSTKGQGGADSPPTYPSSQLHSISNSKESKFPALSRASHSTNDGSSFVESGPHSTTIGSHTSNCVGPSHVTTGFQSHSTDTGSHTSNSLSHSHTSSGSHHSHSNSVLHSTSTGSQSHSNNSGSSSTANVLHSHSGSTSHSHTSSSGSHSHSSTSVSHSHSSSSSSSKESSSKTHSSSRQHHHSHKSHSSGSHSHAHVSHSKHSSHSHSSHGGSSSHTHSLSKHSHKSTDSSLHRSDLEREKTKSSRSSGLTSPSSESVKRQSSRDRLSEHRHSRGGSSSKSNTPSQSPKSSMSTSSSSGSLKQLQQDGGDGKLSNSVGEGGGGGGGGGGGESVTGGGGGGGVAKQTHSSEKLAPGGLVVESMEDWEEESLLEPSARGVTSGGRRDDRREGGGDGAATSKPLPGLRNGEPSTAAMNVIPVLNSAGGSQFGALGVTWQAPNLTHHPPAPPEDDLGFDPWDESNKGLADLLETEETAATMPSSIGREKRESKQHQEAEAVTSNEGELPLPSSSTSLTSWQEEFRSVFPNVNISFSPRLSSKPRNDKDPSSLRHAVDDSTGYSATPLAPTLAYVYPQLVSSATLAMNPAVAASSAVQTRFINTKSHSDGGQERSEWPDFSDSGRSVMSGQQQKQNSWSAERSTTRDPSSSGNGAPPPPGFTPKSKDSSGPNTLSNSVNHSLWANATGQATNMYHNQLLQSWAHYMHLKAIPAQQLSRNQQQLLAQQQQYLARAQQALLMQGHPFLQATMGLQIRPGMIGVGIGHSTAMHSGTTPSGILGHSPHANNGGSSVQASAIPVSGQIGVTIPSSTAKHDPNLSTDEKALNQPGSLYRLVEQSMSNKTESVEFQRTAKKKRPLN